MSDPFPIEPVGADRLDEFFRAAESAFYERPSPAWLEAERSVTDPARTLAAFDGDRIVGTAFAYTLRLSVPGGEVPAAGVTGVGVVPTHRRRGILTSLMRRQLDDVRERGEPVATLWASEGPIYWRYGYGVAAMGAVVEIDRASARFLPDVAGGGPGALRLVEKDEFLRLAPAVHDAVRAERPGMVDRSEAWWSYLFRDDPGHRRGYGEMFFVVHETDGRADGYATYRFKDDWGATGPKGKVGVQELVALAPEANAKLWRFVTDADLSVHTEYWNAPVDDAFFHLLLDPRKAETRVKETLWVRLVDVEAALAARRYAVAGRLVFELGDAFRPGTSGRYELEAGPDGAECRRTDREPDLNLRARDLGSVYLGGVTFSALARAGRVTASSAETLRRADLMFGWSPTPWTAHIF